MRAKSRKIFSRGIFCDEILKKRVLFLSKPRTDRMLLTLFYTNFGLLDKICLDLFFVCRGDCFYSQNAPKFNTPPY